MATLDELRESLQTTNVAALIAKRIDPKLVDIKRLEDPLRGALPTQTWDTNTYFWNQVTQFPYPQSVVEAPANTGTGSVSATQSTYVQKSFPIQHAQVNGDIGKFAIQTAHVSVENLLELEMKRSVQALGWYESLLHIYGSAAGTANSYRPQWDGFERLMNQSTGNIIAPNAGLGGTIALSDLDNLIDAVRVRMAGPLPDNDFFFLTSQPMVSQIGRLLRSSETVFVSTTLSPRRDDGVAGHPVVQVEGGIEVPAYRGVPIVATSFLTPSFGQMGTVTSTGNTGSGSAWTGVTVHFSIVPVTQYGPMYGSADASQAITSTDNLVLSFSTPTATDYLGNTTPVLSYRVYAGSTASNMTLRGIVAAYDKTETATTSITDTGATLLANGRSDSAGVIYGAVASVSATNAGDGINSPLGPANMSTAVPTAGYIEDVYCISRNADFTVVPEVNSVFSQILAPVNLRTIQYGIGSDKCLAVRSGYFASKLLCAKTT